MTLTLEATTTPAPRLTENGDLRLVRAGAHLWRVVERTGRVIGHLQAAVTPGGVRYLARRYHSATATFRDLGEFWSADDAAECVRYGR